MPYRLAWEDNFQKNDAPDPLIWRRETGGHGFGNGEEQFYTDNLRNAFVKDNILNIVALKEECQNRHYTSAKLTTKGIKSIKYGKIEVLAKLPKGGGTWPAIWLLGESIAKIGWPACGEVDIMEHVGHDPGTIHFSLHSKNRNFRIGNQQTYVFRNEDVCDGFHEYAMEWDKDSIGFLFDKKTMVTFQRHENDSADEWPFDENFYMIINLAIGGCWGGPVDPNMFPAVFQIKSVRIWERCEGI
mgnify:CR=1 FL=1